jgi:argininosuccinate lyase
MLDLPAPPGETMRNSLDAVFDRDFALDLPLRLCRPVHAPVADRRGARPVDFCGVRLRPPHRGGGDGLADDAAEAQPAHRRARARQAGTAIGRLTGVLAVVKGLPFAYNRDLQEDKAPAFAARRDVRTALAALTVLVRGLEFERERLAAACADPLLLATDAAEALVKTGVPFRDPHEQLAGVVRDGTYAAGNPRRARRLAG